MKDRREKERDSREKETAMKVDTIPAAKACTELENVNNFIDMDLTYKQASCKAIQFPLWFVIIFDKHSEKSLKVEKVKSTKN